MDPSPQSPSGFLPKTTTGFKTRFPRVTMDLLSILSRQTGETKVALVRKAVAHYLKAELSGPLVDEADLITPLKGVGEWRTELVRSYMFGTLYSEYTLPCMESYRHTGMCEDNIQMRIIARARVRHAILYGWSVIQNWPELIVSHDPHEVIETYREYLSDRWLEYAYKVLPTPAPLSINPDDPAEGMF